MLLGERRLSDWQLVDEAVARLLGIPAVYVHCEGEQPQAPIEQAAALLDFLSSLA